jgi:serine phosphatase RsbU (regulator of sigma subunit)
MELFTHAPSEVLSSIWDKMEEVRLSAGTVLFNTGDPGDGLYLIIEGKLRIVSGNVLLGTREPGEYVGELALLDDSPRSATVEAITDALLLKLYREDFHHVLTTLPEVVSTLLRLLVQKIRNDTAQHAAILHQQEELQYDLRRAYEIQTAMLPSGNLGLDWVHLAGRSQPAAIVGGDYYDYFQLPDGCVSVAIGDVVGHGFYSSLLVAIVSSALHFQVERDATPVSVHGALNKVVRNYRHTRLLMTFSYMILNPADRTFTLTNAGHPYPFLYRHAECRWTSLQIDSLPLGSLLHQRPEEMTVKWELGDRLFLYSDGLIEAQNELEQIYGGDALEGFLYKNASLTPNEMIARMYEELKDYCGGRPFDDDVTVAVVEFS